MNSKTVAFGIAATILSAQALAVEPKSDHSPSFIKISSFDEVKPDEVVKLYACPPPFVPPQCN